MGYFNFKIHFPLNVVVFLILGPLAQNLLASEIDSFTQRSVPMADATDALNQAVNEKLLLAFDEANNIKGCSTSRLYQFVRYHFTGSILGPVEQMINAGNFVESKTITRKDSVLRDIGMISGSALYFYGLGNIINLDGHTVGSDKFGHFFSEGWTYFDRSVLKEQDLIDVLRFGESSERGFFGWTMTGVMSYGDLAANFSGLRFWINLIQNDKRVEERNYGLLDPKIALASCVDGKWALNRAFDWRNFTDSSWDEGINCSVFLTPELEILVANRIAQALKGTQFQPSCPVDPAQCDELVAKYGPLGRYILHPRCFAQGLKKVGEKSSAFPLPN